MLNDLKNSCKDDCKEFTANLTEDIIDMETKVLIPNLWMKNLNDTIKPKNENEYRIDNFYYNSTLPQTETTYIKLITELELKLKEINYEIHNVKEKFSVMDNYDSLKNVIKNTYSYIDRLHDYLELIIGYPKERSIEDFLPYSTMTEELKSVINSQNLSSSVPFGINAVNAMQYMNVDVKIENKIISVKLSLPLIDVPTRRGHVYEVIPIPIRSKNGTFFIKPESPYAIISDTFTPLQTIELQKCKTTANLNICSPQAKRQRESCELKLFKNASLEEIFDICTVEKIASKNYVTPIGPYSVHLYVDSYIRIAEHCPKRFRHRTLIRTEEESFKTDGILTIKDNCALNGDEFGLHLNKIDFHHPFTVQHNLNEIYEDRHNKNLKNRLINHETEQTYDEHDYEENNDVTPIAIDKKRYEFNINSFLVILIVVLICVRIYGYFRSEAPNGENYRMQTMM